MKRTFSIFLVVLVLAGCCRKNSPAGRESARIWAVEKEFVNYLSSLQGGTVFQAADSIRAYFERYGQDSIRCEVVRKYLYDPNSPYRNEELYLPFVQGLATAEFTPDSLRDSYMFEARMCSLNRIGQNAADFDFEESDGTLRHLYGIKAEVTLLMFSNPGCEDCERVTDLLTGNKIIAGAVESGKLAVVNIYIDEELDLWRENVVDYPAEWYNGFDPNFVIREDLIYNVRAIPSLYVLDADKRVIYKDATVESVLGLLENVF